MSIFSKKRELTHWWWLWLAIPDLSSEGKRDGQEEAFEILFPNICHLFGSNKVIKINGTRFVQYLAVISRTDL